MWSDEAGIPTADVYTQSGQCIALSPDENMANARLIAAAPDLLAACQSVLDFEPIPESLTPRETALVNQLRAAIARATGA